MLFVHFVLYSSSSPPPPPRIRIRLRVREQVGEAVNRCGGGGEGLYSVYASVSIVHG